MMEIISSSSAGKISQFIGEVFKHNTLDVQIPPEVWCFRHMFGLVHFRHMFVLSYSGGVKMSRNAGW